MQSHLQVVNILNRHPFCFQERVTSYMYIIYYTCFLFWNHHTAKLQYEFRIIWYHFQSRTGLRWYVGIYDDTVSVVYSLTLSFITYIKAQYLLSFILRQTTSVTSTKHHHSSTYISFFLYFHWWKPTTVIKVKAVLLTSCYFSQPYQSLGARFHLIFIYFL